MTGNREGIRRTGREEEGSSGRRRETRSRGLLQSLRGQRESAAPVVRSLASTLSSVPPALATRTQHTRAVLRARTHPRTHACMHACRNRGYSRPRKRKLSQLHTFSSHRVNSYSLRPRFVFLLPLHLLHPPRVCSLIFALLSTLLLAERTREREIRRLRS